MNTNQTVQPKEIIATDKRGADWLRRFVRRMVFTLITPIHPRRRTVLTAIRAGYVDGNYKLTGFDNKFTRWFWDKFVRTIPSERKRMYEYLKRAKNEIRTREIWSGESA